MRVNKSKWKMTDMDFGPLLPYIQDENVTDINYNGSAVWIDDLTRGRYCADVTLHKNFIERFTQRVADAVSETFNQYNPLLEAETDTLRISIVHEEYANTGRSISIRKTPVIRRLNREKMIKEEYCEEEVLNFIEKCVLAKMNMLMCGLPGTGKTEFLKYLTNFIPAEDRAITIEDNLEIHYSEINPGKDCVELKVDSSNSLKNNEGERFTYVTAIKACLRQNPQWILLSEARSTEVKYLMESMSTGTHCLTTIHTDDVRKVPDRIKNMVQDSVIAARIENDVFMFLDAAILVKKKMKNGRIFRYIDQMCFFSREEGGVNEIVMVVENGKLINKELPFQIMNKFAQSNIFNPFADEPSVSEAEEVESYEFAVEDVSTEHVDDEDVPQQEKEELEQSVPAESLTDEAEDFVRDEVAQEETSQDEEPADDADVEEIPSESNSSVNEELDGEILTEAPLENEKTEDGDTSVEETQQEAPADQKDATVIKYDDSENELENLLDFSYERHQRDDEARLRRAKNRGQ